MHMLASCASPSDQDSFAVHACFNMLDFAKPQVNFKVDVSYRAVGLEQHLCFYVFARSAAFKD